MAVQTYAKYLCQSSFILHIAGLASFGHTWVKLIISDHLILISNDQLGPLALNSSCFLGENVQIPLSLKYWPYNQFQGLVKILS